MSGSAATEPAGTLPDGSSVPAHPLQTPASVSSDGDVTGTIGGVTGDATQIVATSSTNGIPSAALAAYQRAETVINAADKSCNLTWQLVAAIGRVESNHGRFAGNALDANGVARPGILGARLDGKGGTRLIRDTDAGQYDSDKIVDRAVGPMQFIPSTWSVVGVDADNDGVRDPQDIDDAALATAVYLCSGTDNLATLPGKRAAVYRYNHSNSYVDLVLDIADAYLDGDYTAIPNGTVAAGYLNPDPNYQAPPLQQSPTDTIGAESEEPAPAAEATTEPADEPAAEPSSDTTRPPSDGPTLPLPPVTVPALPHTNVGPVDDVLTLAQAIVQCTLDGHLDNLLRNDDPFDRCVDAYTTAQPKTSKSNEEN